MQGLKFVDAPKFGRIVVVGGATSKAIPLKLAYFDPISCPSLHFIGHLSTLQIWPHDLGCDLLPFCHPTYAIDELTMSTLV
jgi:hypothetical protein